MECLVVASKSFEYRHCLWQIRLWYDNRLESAFKRSVLFDVLVILCRCRCTNNPDLATRQCWFKNIACVHGTLSCACTHNQMYLVDENNRVCILFEFLHYFFKTFLELATIFCASDHSGKIQCDHTLVYQTVRYVFRNNTLCETFYDSSLTNTRLTNQYRVIFSSAIENSDNSTDLCFTTNDWIQLAFTRLGR